MSKVVVCGAGFLGSNIARAVALSTHSNNRVQISSRNPEKIYNSLQHTVPENCLLPAVSLDITKPNTLESAFRDASIIVSLVGVMHGTRQDFENIQWAGAKNVAEAARNAGAKLIHFSAIGADPNSAIDYNRTKGLAEQSALRICPDATIIRPSIVFGPQDDFFNRFSRLSHFLPFLPVFGGGHSKFQPVFVGDIARAVEIICRSDPATNGLISGKTMEAGGPDVFTYRQMMELVLRYNHRVRPIISLPFAVGKMQGAILERLPTNLFTVTQAQVEQLKSDNVVSSDGRQVSFQDFVETHSPGPLASVHDVLPTYL